MNIKNMKYLISGALILSLLLLTLPVSTVFAAAPTVTSLNPGTGMQDTTLTQVVIQGTNLVDPSTVTFSGTGVAASETTFVTNGILSTNITIAANAATGPRDVTVTNSNGGVTKPSAFTVTAPPAPSITSLSPNKGIAGAVYKNVVITGSNFLNNTSLDFSLTGVTASSIVVVSSTQLTATISVAAGASIGFRDVTATTLGGTGTKTGGFEVTSPQIPTITSISPAFGNNTGIKQPMVITGANFTTTSTVNFSGSGVAASDISVFDATKINLNYTVDPAATAGARDITVSTPNGASNARVFTVYRAAVSVNSPGGAAPGSDFWVYINVSSVSKLDSSQFDLIYNPTVIAVVGSEGGTGIADGLIGGSAYKMESWGFVPPGTPGLIRVLNNNPGISGVTGSGYLVKINFHVIGAAGTLSNLNLVTVPAPNPPLGSEQAEIILASGDGPSMPADSVNSGNVRINGLAITSVTLPEATLNKNYSTNNMIAATGGTQPYTWSAAGLPLGLNIDPATGVISGIPTQIGDFIVSLTVVDNAVKFSTSGGFLLHVYPALSVTTAALPDATAAVGYSKVVAATGGKPGYSWSATGLPGGLSIDASTGIISGLPTAAGDFTNIVITAMDSFSPQNVFSRTLTLHVNPINGAIQITTETLPDARAGSLYSFTMSAGGGTSPYTWSTNTTLPSDLHFSSAGVLSGTPAVSGNTAINFTVTDSSQTTASLPITLHVYDPLQIQSSSLAEGPAGSPYSTTVVATGGKTPYHWSAAGLPSNLAIDPATGVISGTPAAAGEASVAITVTDSASPANTAGPKAFTLKTYAVLQITTPSPLPDAMVGKAYSTTISATGGKLPYTWSATGLPAGLGIDAATGVVSGNLTASGTINNINITVTDSFGTVHNTLTGTFMLTIYPALTIQTAALPRSGVETGATLPPVPGWMIGVPYTANLTATGGKDPYHWTSTVLPPGLTLSDGGAFTGTPARSGLFEITFTITDSASPPKSVSKTFSLQIYKVGDANGDDTVDVADMTYVERVILGLNVPTAGSDAGLNGSISIGDIAIIDNIILNPG